MGTFVHKRSCSRMNRDGTGRGEAEPSRYPGAHARAPPRARRPLPALRPMTARVGVHALQGDVREHLRVLTETGLVTAEDRGRERHYALARPGLAPVRDLLDELAGRRPPIPESALDALDLEVRRTVHDRRAGTDADPGTGRSEEESA